VGLVIKLKTDNLVLIMNFIAATVELRSHTPDPINAYGLDYCGADVIVPANGSNSEVRLRALCYNREGSKLSAFKNWKTGTKVLVTGNIVFSNDTKEPLDIIISTIEPNIPQDMFCNQVVLGSAFFADDQIKDRKNGIAVKIGSTLDNSDVVTWLYMETHESRKAKLQDRIRKGRSVCVQGYLREYRKDDSDSPYRAIVANDFSTRKDRPRSSTDPASNSSAAGYSEIDPAPTY
jgi:hypothetical protein